MEGNPVRKALACFATVALIASVAGSASAAMTKEDAGCRSTIQKNAGKLGATTIKTLIGCVKSQLGNKIALTNGLCTTVNATSDSKGKVAGAAGKVGPAVQKKCVDKPATAAALAEYQPTCPSPASDTSVTSFPEVAACQVDINKKMIENVMKYILNPDATAIFADAGVKDIIKCANGIGKNAAKLWSTVSKERGKCQATIDKGLAGSYDYACSTTAIQKITDGIAAAKTSINTTCSVLSANQLGKIHTCSAKTTGATSIGDCVTKAIVKNAGGATATAFEFGQVCPIEVRVQANSGSGDGTHPTNTVVTKSNLDAGWTGLGHHTDIVDGFVGRVNLSCSDNTCSSCTVTTNCEAGNCRCSSSFAQCGTTTGPFTQDTCPLGQTCLPNFGPPLALSAAGNPTCVTNIINTELVGTANVGTGASVTTVKDIAKVFLGISQSQPCPRCSGATIGAAGTCSGGANNGAACVTNALHPDFGATSYQCQPSLAQNISGSGLKVNLTLTNGAVSLAPGDPCEAPLGASMCWCGVCSGDATVTCNGDADCAALALGTCGKGAGADRRPNQCGDGTCEDAGNGNGQCTNDEDKYCSGLVRDNGGGIITCSVNADCAALDPECPGGGPGACGTCSISQTRSCFRNPIVATGLAGQDGAELVSTFCSGPTTNAGINLAGGIPGPGRVVIDWDFIGYCPDGTTEFELGGNNCP